MGPRWATGTDADGAIRIADPDDFVRLEVETALERADVTVIPVLVGGARMPDPDDLPPGVAPITRRNAIELSDGRWRYDVGRLMTRLEELLAGHHRHPRHRRPRRQRHRHRPKPVSPPRILAEGVGLAALAGLIGGGLADSIFDVGLEDGMQVLKRVATWIPVAIAISLWLTLRVAKQNAVALKVVLAVAVGALAAAIAGALSFLPDEKSDGMTVAAFSVLGTGFGGIVGGALGPAPGRDRRRGRPRGGSAGRAGRSRRRLGARARGRPASSPVRRLRPHRPARRRPAKRESGLDLAP